MEQHWHDFLLFQLMLAAIKHIVNYYLFCSATQHMTSTTQFNCCSPEMSCKLTILKKSSSNWLNSSKSVIQHLSERM